MGGHVAIAIRRNSRQSGRVLGKYAAAEVARPELFSGEGEFWETWKSSSEDACAPDDYGLVAVDFDKKWIGGIQSYTSFDRAYFYHPTKEERGLIQGLWETGRIGGIEHRFGELPVKNSTTFEDFMAEIKTYQRERGAASICLAVSPHPGWTFEPYEDTAEGWMDFATELSRRGWRFSAQDIAQWETFAQDKGLPDNVVGAAIARSVHEDLNRVTPNISNNAPSRRF